MKRLLLLGVLVSGGVTLATVDLSGADSGEAAGQYVKRLVDATVSSAKSVLASVMFEKTGDAITPRRSVDVDGASDLDRSVPKPQKPVVASWSKSKPSAAGSIADQPAFSTGAAREATLVASSQPDKVKAEPSERVLNRGAAPKMIVESPRAEEQISVAEIVEAAPSSALVTPEVSQEVLSKPERSPRVTDVKPAPRVDRRLRHSKPRKARHRKRVTRKRRRLTRLRIERARARSRARRSAHVVKRRSRTAVRKRLVKVKRKCFRGLGCQTYVSFRRPRNRAEAKAISRIRNRLVAQRIRRQRRNR